MHSLVAVTVIGLRCAKRHNSKAKTGLMEWSKKFFLRKGVKTLASKMLGYFFIKTFVLSADADWHGPLARGPCQPPLGGSDLHSILHRNRYKDTHTLLFSVVAVGDFEWVSPGISRKW